LLKNGASGRDQALHGLCECRYAALSKTPCALADGLILIFQHLSNRKNNPTFD